MYDNPLMILREYIQNSVDAIQAYKSDHNHSDNNSIVDVIVDGRFKSVLIRDNGSGIPAKKAWHILHDLGKSEKDRVKSRGFRGIGRLGGLGYCDELIFRTKAENEDIVSASIWDCGKLRQLLKDKDHVFEAPSIASKIVTFKQEKYDGDLHEHFFSVELNRVRSSRDLLINVPAIKDYISQVAPVPFKANGFTFSKLIDSLLRKQVPTYETFNIKVNGEAIYKPYSDLVCINKNGRNQLNDISFLNISNNDKLIAFGWIGELDLLGSIWPSSLVDGIRVRCGNIQIGDKDLLAELYREKRFNNYILGEIHIVDNRLIPNSRRDDFEDSELRDSFHTSFIREIGLPVSKKIRDLSISRSKEKNTGDIEILFNRADHIIEHGFISEEQKQEIISKMRAVNGRKPDKLSEVDIITLIQKLEKARHIISKRKMPKLSGNLLTEQIFKIIYNEMGNKIEAEHLIERIAASLFS